MSAIRFHLRGLRRHGVGLVRAVLGMKGPAVDLSATTASFHRFPDPSHPSQTCRCSCGIDAPPEHHSEHCPWAQSMCGGCLGGGYCAACGGDGIDPNAPPFAYQRVEDA